MTADLDESRLRRPSALSDESMSARKPLQPRVLVAALAPVARLPHPIPCHPLEHRFPTRAGEAAEQLAMMQEVWAQHFRDHEDPLRAVEQGAVTSQINGVRSAG